MRSRVYHMLATTVLIASYAQAGLAADLPARTVYKAPPVAPAVAPYSWAGFYIGAHGGGAWASKKWGDASTDCNAFAPAFGGLGIGCFADQGKHTAEGAIYGVQAGFNLQRDAFVFGIEGQFSFSNLRASHSRTTEVEAGDGHSTFTGTQTFSTKVRDLGTIAVRLGWATGQLRDTLWFVKGGGAFADDRFAVVSSGSCEFTGSGTPCPSLPDSASASLSAKQFRWGWMVGAGVEHKFTPAVSAKLEYNYLGLGKQDVTLTGIGCVNDPGNNSPCGPVSRSMSIDQNIHLVKAGLNFHFGGPWQ